MLLPNKQRTSNMNPQIGKLYTAVKMLEKTREEKTREANPIVFKDFKCLSTNKIRFLKDNEVFVLLSSPVIINKYLQENSYKILTSDGIIGYIWDNSEDSLIFTEMNE